MNGKLEKYEAELESARKANELSIIPMSRFHADTNLEELYVLCLSIAWIISLFSCVIFIKS